MKNINAYLTFNGNCEEALNFYKEKLNGKIKSIMRFSEAPMPSDEADKNKVMHSEFTFGESMFFASDSMPSQPVNSGNNVTLCLNADDVEEGRKYFDNLSAGGNVFMAYDKTFWGSMFGMCTDRFGISWMVNVQLEEGRQTM